MIASNPERHGLAWSAEEEKQLYDAFVAGKPVQECAEIHQRKPGGIVGCLRKLGLLDEGNRPITPRPNFAPSAAAIKRQVKATIIAQRKIARAKEKESVKQNLAPERNERFREALHLMEETDKNIFITGKAGTGKSTLLSYFCRTTDKRPVVLAPTGVAALNVKGQTIHRFFNFYVDVTPEKIRGKKGGQRNAKLFKKLKTIIIDEVSMVRADLLDCIDVFLRMHGPDPTRVFGGVQMIFVGDLYQLPPVVTSQDKDIFSSHYDTPYFFSAHALQEIALEQVELNKVYRQKDQGFVDLLNKIRNNSVDADDIARINSRHMQDNTSSNGDLHITLTTTNAIADGMNDQRIRTLEGKLFTSTADIDGAFDKEYFPTVSELSYKMGAQIMLLNNDSEQRWVNGSIGVIEAIKDDEDGKTYLAVRLQGHKGIVDVYPHTWEVYRFGLEDGTIVAEPTGRFTQFPFRLAWAITIHKSQGKTFQNVAIDIGRGAFVAGQIYVALSRCTSLEGVTLKTPIRAQDIRTDQRITSFLSTRQIASWELNSSGSDISLSDKIALIQKTIAAQAALDITYLKADNSRTTRKVIPLIVGTAKYQGAAYDGMKAFCTIRQEECMFRVDRILKIGMAKR
jgi:hypothetical protein